MYNHLTVTQRAAMTPTEGQRLEPIIYYCDVRRRLFKRDALIDDELNVRRQLNGTVLLLKTAYNGHKQLLIKSIQGKSPRFVESGSKSLPAYLFGPEWLHARRVPGKDLWDLTKSAYLKLAKEEHEQPA